MREMRLHGGRNWCHFCGRQDTHEVDVFYPDNASLAVSCTPNTRYVRVCRGCIAEMQALTGTAPQGSPPGRAP